MSKKNSADRRFVVIYADGYGLTSIMTWSKEYESVLEYWVPGEKIATFPSRAEARRAINISTKFAELNDALGKPSNGDFARANRKFLTVAECSHSHIEAVPHATAVQNWESSHALAFDLLATMRTMHHDPQRLSNRAVADLLVRAEKTLQELKPPQP